MLVSMLLAVAMAQQPLITLTIHDGNIVSTRQIVSATFNASKLDVTTDRLFCNGFEVNAAGCFSAAFVVQSAP